jgi:hypothetical protein
MDSFTALETEREREGEKALGLLTRGRRAEHSHWRSPETMDAGEQRRGIARGGERQSQREEK